MIFLAECNYKGQTYNVGQKFPAGDDCNTCTCESNGRVSCTEKTCCMCYFDLLPLSLSHITNT